MARKLTPMDTFDDELETYLAHVAATEKVDEPNSAGTCSGDTMAAEQVHAATADCVVTPTHEPAPDAQTCSEVDGAWLVDKVLKQGMYETTQKVYLRLSGVCDVAAVADKNEGLAAQNDHEKQVLLGPFVRKLIAKDAGLGAAYRQLMEAQRSGAQLMHVPRVLSCGERNGSLEVVMEWLDGRTLEQEVRLCGDAQARQALVARVFVEVCDAVSELHEGMACPVIHRDLTPSNVLLMADGRAMLVDLGIARTWQQSRQVDTTHFGTRGYAPPEQFGFGQTDVRSDVYTLGELLRFCLTGEHPGETYAGGGSDADGGSDANGVAGAAGAPGCVDAACGRYAGVIHMATQLDPALRFQSARALKQAILSVMAEKNVASGGSSRQCAPQAKSEGHEGGKRVNRGVPAWLGQCWNVVLVGSLVLNMAAVVGISASGLPSVARGSEHLYYSLYWVVYIPLCAMWTYVLLDKRRLSARFAAVEAWPTRRAAKSAAVASAALLVSWAVLAVITFA